MSCMRMPCPYIRRHAEFIPIQPGLGKGGGGGGGYKRVHYERSLHVNIINIVGNMVI